MAYKQINPIFTGGLELRYLPGGGRFGPPPTISAPSNPIFKILVSICSSGPKERTYKILSRSDKKYGFYGSSKKIGTRGHSGMGYIAKN